ncbi:hypothetical protein B0J18DRAFT_439513 [Chaetomium sp. MPI-SDFR-AT-0129]|nr:hypothetical protein B0J18DRAFT_439513 [Chaetomium sp. MPI-SDFR-AT-0129]
MRHRGFALHGGLLMASIPISHSIRQRSTVDQVGLAPTYAPYRFSKLPDTTCRLSFPPPPPPTARAPGDHTDCKGELSAKEIH